MQSPRRQEENTQQARFHIRYPASLILSYLYSKTL